VPVTNKFGRGFNDRACFLFLILFYNFFLFAKKYSITEFFGNFIDFMVQIARIPGGFFDKFGIKNWF